MEGGAKLFGYHCKPTAIKRLISVLEIRKEAQGRIGWILETAVLQHGSP